MEESFRKIFHHSSHSTLRSFFLQYYKYLQYLYDEYKVFGEKYGRENLEMYSIEIDSTLAQQFDLIQLNKERRLDVDVTIFDQLLQQYRDEEERTCNLIVNSIMKILKKKSQKYVREK